MPLCAFNFDPYRFWRTHLSPPPSSSALLSNITRALSPFFAPGTTWPTCSDWKSYSFLTAIWWNDLTISGGNAGLPTAQGPTIAPHISLEPDQHRLSIVESAAHGRVHVFLHVPIGHPAGKLWGSKGSFGGPVLKCGRYLPAFIFNAMNDQHPENGPRLIESNTASRPVAQASQRPQLLQPRVTPFVNKLGARMSSPYSIDSAGIFRASHRQGR